uniref:Uncharacterized protein n=1 Tax=Panagrellus redivivus TaxID=6233 RepID=A0A7E4WC02_PANRE
MQTRCYGRTERKEAESEARTAQGCAEDTTGSTVNANLTRRTQKEASWESVRRQRPGTWTISIAKRGAKSQPASCVGHRHLRMPHPMAFEPMKWPRPTSLAIPRSVLSMKLSRGSSEDAGGDRRQDDFIDWETTEGRHAQWSRAEGTLPAQSSADTLKPRQAGSPTFEEG